MIVLQGTEETAERLAFTPGGRGLIASLSGGLQIWEDVTAGGPPRVEGGHYDLSFPQFTPDGRAMLFGGMRVVIRDVASGNETSLMFQEPLTPPFTSAVALSPDARHLVAAQSGTCATTPRGRLTCRAMTKLESDTWTIAVDRHFHNPPIFLPGGDRFVTIEWWAGIGHDFGPMFVTRTLHTGETLAVFKRENRDRDRPCEFPVASADRRLVAARNAGRIAVYNSEDFAAPPALIKNDGRKHFTGIAFHPSGRYLAATNNDKTVKLYDTTSWEVAKTFTWDVGRMRSIAFSPDGTLAAAGSDSGKVVVWDVDV